MLISRVGQGRVDMKGRITIKDARAIFHKSILGFGLDADVTGIEGSTL